MIYTDGDWLDMEGGTTLSGELILNGLSGLAVTLPYVLIPSDKKE